jgi:tRNA pseudouridine55 synthase
MSQLASLFGVLNLNKPTGITSRDLVNRVQRIVRPLKTGHAGTLDPLASGVLLVCVGDATRLVERLQKLRKTYVAEFILGQSSDTDDCTGEVVIQAVSRPVPTADEVVSALQQLTGVVAQVPPSFSAVHVNGRRAYDLARRGEMPELQAREVEIHEITVLEYSWPVLRLRIECGSGTYVRSIARDLGLLLECGGLMSGLERVAIGPFTVADSIGADLLSGETILASLISPLQIVQDLPTYRCNEQDLVDLRCGRRLTLEQQRLTCEDVPTAGSEVALTMGDPPALVAMGCLLDCLFLQPRMVFLH